MVYLFEMVYQFFKKNYCFLKIIANRFLSEISFGQVVLTIIHVLPHDSGVYSCRAFNLKGEATTSATVKVAGYEKILYETQHPVSWQRIQELECPRIVEDNEIVEEKEKPRFLTQLNSYDGINLKFFE